MSGRNGWTALRVRPTPGRGDAVSAALFAAGSLGIQEDGDLLVTQFPSVPEADRAEAAVRGADAGAAVERRDVPDTDWSAEWKRGIGAHHLGALVVAPPWLAGELDRERTIVIEPGMAFGTGEHATTRGVVRLMQPVLRAGDVVADLGAGSAVLAIAAAKLGAARVVAIEIDPEAIPDAEANVRRNDVAQRVAVIEGDAALLLPLVAPVQLVLANIISSVLVALLPTIAGALTPGGHAILSGILREERDTMLSALAAQGWRVDSEDTEDVWWGALIARR
ncbi:MAG TPA: 50S ribosomal protein L11 methyltransferase [Gemmatimonadaceae bacterium]|nr:50S ribosomal protein L11 methyltransferase [Gemmatimonadaceae bacterium]